MSPVLFYLKEANMRKLASIQTITDIHPIEGKDRIVLATVEGWHVIVTKDFSVGDKVCYVEIDSLMPERPEFEFLRPKKFKIKTMKMGNAVSQGICFPLSILPPRDTPYEVGEDVTEILGVKHIEESVDDPVPANSAPQKKYGRFVSFLLRFAPFRRMILPKKETGAFPSEYISKTDETRCQTIPWLFGSEVANHTTWIATEKIDGTSGTWLLVQHRGIFGRRHYEYYVCSRNRRLVYDDGSIYWEIEHKYDIRAKLMNLIGDKEFVAIQGECIGPKIQRNKYKVSEPDMFVFNYITPTGRVPSIRARDMLGTRGFLFVPIISQNFTLPDTVDGMVEAADGISALNSSVMREGLVIRSLDGTSSFKAVSNKFLLKWQE